MNSIYLLDDEIDFDYVSELVGGKMNLRKKLKIVERKAKEPGSEIDETLTKLIYAQNIRDLDANSILLVDNKRREIDKLISIIESF